MSDLQAMFIARQAFDGSSESYRLAQKGLIAGSADAVSSKELKNLWMRSHHLFRNSGVASSAKTKLISNWVGTGIKARWSNKKMQKIWDEFAENPNLDGYGTLQNTQETWASALIESGDCLTRLVTKSGDTKIPLKLQTMEAEQLDPLYSSLTGNVKYGIGFSADGQPTTYHPWKSHPDNHTLLAESINKRISVPADKMLHAFFRKRPGQWRGLPMLTSVLLPIYEMDELTDATLVRQKAAQAMGWIVTKKGSGAMPLAGTIVTDTVPVAPGDEVDDPATNSRLQKILPGGIHYLEEDEDFTFAESQDIGSNFAVMLKQQWSIIAAALELTYEQLTGDLSNVNFSSIRAGLVEFRKRAEMVQQLIFINLLLKPLAKHVQELAGVYESKNMLNATVSWILPKVEWVDPLKDTQGDVLEIRAGLATLQEKLAERGKDFDATMQQLAIEQGVSIEELVLDSNPIHNTKDVTTVTDDNGEAEIADKSPKQTKTEKEAT